MLDLRVWYAGIELPKGAPGISDAEHPPNSGSGSISLFRPVRRFPPQGLLIGDSTVKALPAEHADLDLDHVEPAGVLGREVELKPS